MCDIRRFERAEKLKKKKKEKPPPIDCGDEAHEFPEHVTLVKWARPTLLTTFQGLGRKPFPKGGFKSYEMPEGFPPVPDIPGLLKAPTTIEDFDVSEKDTAAILEIMFKPKEWTEGERKWKQHVSTKPADRPEVLHLTEEMESLLLRSNSRSGGICETRQHLFMQCFDEIIRQVTINCAERGLLLTEIRDELTLTLQTYKTLVEQALDFGFHKAEQSKEIEENLRLEYEKLVDKKNELEDSIMDGKLKMAATYRAFRDQRKATERTRNLKLAYLQRSNDQFFYMLDNIGMDKKHFFHLM